MEALVACSVASLTIYDMCKSIDKKIVVTDLKLDYKSGGKSEFLVMISFNNALKLMRQSINVSKKTETINIYDSHKE